ncbi:aromatic ring-hydroxylating dioxygenase subunit alpha [Novosphingobium sp.]|uniref:aromatic ring-hydroxylating oxygenase subunit alpha n=1 Tax=Novosphingobium sp. TaxID=1874826 RepID=UPI0026134C2A|nr:aromatic ring-hydroxylating dioxygenase subunit alpha [Novosphingobium sp.]
MTNRHTDPALAGEGTVRPDYIPAANYLSREFAALEAKHLWPRTWQMACREEEIPTVGSFFTYDILDDSISIVRIAPDEIRAYHNSCPHRGRRITEGCGKSARLHCRFHGWQWTLDGQNLKVVDRDDWGDKLTADDVNLTSVKVGRWGGWVYINMDPDCESLEEALSPAKALLDPFVMEGMRYHWRKSTILPCNWKVALEAFSEGYHVQTTHPQMLQYFDDVTTSYAHGRHGMFGYWDSAPTGLRSPRLGGPRDGEDNRTGLLAYMEETVVTLNAVMAEPGIAAAKRLVERVPAGTDPWTVLGKFNEYMQEVLIERGIECPEISNEAIMAAGTDWHLFPNQVILQSPIGVLGYRARPNGDDPDSCRWDVYSLMRFPAGEVPTTEWQWSDDLKDEKFWGKILVQDYQNMKEVQMGMKSRGFKGARPNPKQEVPVANFHRALCEFIRDGQAG